MREKWVPRLKFTRFSPKNWCKHIPARLLSYANHFINSQTPFTLARILIFKGPMNFFQCGVAFFGTLVHMFIFSFFEVTGLFFIFFSTSQSHSCYNMFHFFDFYGSFFLYFHFKLRTRNSMRLLHPLQRVGPSLCRFVALIVTLKLKSVKARI